MQSDNKDRLWTLCLGELQLLIDKTPVKRRVINVSWNKTLLVIKQLKNCNPFSRDAKGHFLRNVILTGCLWEKVGKFEKIEIVYSDTIYQKDIVHCIDNLMFFNAKYWNQKFEPFGKNGEWSKKTPLSPHQNEEEREREQKRIRWEKKTSFRIDLFPSEAKEISIQMLLVNKRLNNQINSDNSNNRAYGLLPRGVLNIVIGYVLSNYILSNITSEKCMSKSLIFYQLH